MELNTKYSPSDTEARWYAHWEKRGYFRSTPDDREPFTIVIPPPNVTGVLHMGHMLNNTIQDILIRKARMDGKNACWVPGTDHASIATEAKVVQWLRSEMKLKKSDLTREEFMGYAYQWKDKYGGIILQQLRRLGASCDWDRTAFTMDKGYYQDVLHVFTDLYKKGKLYRGQRMVNWDPEALTVLSSEEVLFSEEKSVLFHIHYKQADGSDGITIATQRPETIFADVAIAVNPKDPRYKSMVGKKVLIPLINKEIPVIADNYVDIEFGTGALKITPAHDPNDYEVGQRHGLEIIDTITDDGKLSAACAFAPIVGLDRFEARKKMQAHLESVQCLVKLEDYVTKIGRSERTNAVVEPKLSLQWFVKMTDLREPAVRAVMKREIRFFPDNFRNMYMSWMDGLRDWCISRQLWWGQRIPAWYLKTEALGKETFIFVATNEAEALQQAKDQTGNKALTLQDLRQEEDVLDTWASSWIWPISVFDGFAKPEGEFKYYYPTNVLVTGWDIIFFWVARMIMAGYEFKGERPFEKVYLTGMVRDKLRRKMSKSLGNSPDALGLIDEYGADGVRYGMLASSPAGGDLLFDDKLCENGRNFSNKLWNATRLVSGWPIAKKAESEAVARKNALAIKWFEQKMKLVLTEVEGHFKTFRLSDALQTLYSFIWDDFCAWYLEMIKPTYEKPIDEKTLKATLNIFEKLMIALHPFMPFVTEEIWHVLKERKEGDDCMIQMYPKKGKSDKALLAKVETAKEVITKIREIRQSNQIKPREELNVIIQKSDSANLLFDQAGLKEMLMKMANLSQLDISTDEPSNSKSFVVGTEKYFVELVQEIDVEAEREKVTKELEHQRGFVKSVQSKLSNERFVGSAPAAVVDAERKKLADGLARIALLEKML
jgi:valyl-tRNA synthetase